MNAVNKENEQTQAACDMDLRTLSAWFDGEAGVRGHWVEAHLRTCPHCPQRLAQMRRAQGAVVTALDKAMGPLEPLIGLQRIRERIVHRQTRPGAKRLLGVAHDIWLFQRPAVAGIAVAALLSLSGLVAWQVIDVPSPTGPAGVVVESLHVETDAKTHVTASPDGRSTLIWVDAPPPEGAYGKP